MNQPFEIPAGIVGRADQLNAMIDDLYKIVDAQFDAEARGDLGESQTIAAGLGYVIDQIPQDEIKPMIVVLLARMHAAYSPISDNEGARP